MEIRHYDYRYKLLYDIYYFFEDLSFDDIFIKILEMSFAAAIIIPFILLIRLLIFKLPKKYSYFIWSAVFIRLLLPFNFNFPLGFGREIDIEGYSLSKKGINFLGAANAALRAVGDAANGGIGIQHIKGEEHTYVSRFWEVWILFGKYIWLTGFILMLTLGIISAIKLKKKLSASVYLKDNIYLCDYIDTALVKGIFHPKIYISSKIREDEALYIIFHEKFHVTRHDHLLKLLAYFILAVNWFNPLVWLFFIYFSEDMELSCDEAVLSYFGESDKQQYRKVMLDATLRNKRNLNTSLYFGEGSLKKRLINALNFTKPSKLTTCVSVFLTVIRLILLLTSNSITVLGNLSENNDYSVNFATMEKFGDGDSDVNPAGSDCVILKREETGDYNKIYAVIMYKKYDFNGEVFTPLKEVFTPAVIECEKFINEAGTEDYEILSYIIPKSGESFESEVRSLFPDNIENEALNFEEYRNGLEYNCLKSAMNTVAYNYFRFSNDINWQENKFTKDLPPLEKGDIKWVSFYSNTTAFIAIDNIDSDYILSYANNLQLEGYTNKESYSDNYYRVYSIEPSVSVYFQVGENCVLITID